MIQDLEGGDIEQELLDDAGVGLGLQMSHFLVRGTGRTNNQSWGVATRLGAVTNAPAYEHDSQIIAQNEVAASASLTSGGINTLITYPKMVDLMHSIPEAYVNDPSCAFMTSWFNVGKLRQVLDNEKRPIFDMDPTGVFPGRILGKPVVADPAFPNIPNALTGTAGSARTAIVPNIIFGCWKNYVMRLAGGLRVDRSDEDRFSNDEVSWRFLQRYDGDVLDPWGFAGYTTHKIVGQKPNSARRS